ncbi:MAG: TIR domain-containing protein [Pseudomarimonas sp.]
MRHLAFISYRHIDHDRAHAEALESAVKRYAKPVLKPPVSVFRDERVLRPGDSLSKQIRRGLEQSKYLIYIASAAAAKSPWVADELRYWCNELGRKDQLIIAHVSNNIVCDAATQRVLWPLSDALPAILESHIDDIPFWLDLTWATTAERRDLHDPEYRKAINALSARLREIEPGAMNDQEVLTHRSNVRLRNAAVSAMLVLALVAGFGWYQSNQNATALVSSLSDTQVRLAQAAVEANSPDEALARLGLAMRTNPDNRVAVDRALHLIQTRQANLLNAVTPAGGGARVLEFRSSPSAEHAVAMLDGGEVKVWHQDLTLPIWTLSIPGATTIKVAEGAAVVLTLDGSMILLDFARKSSKKLSGLPAAPGVFELVHDGSTIAVAGGREICIRSPPDAESCDKLKASHDVSDISVSPDGREVLTASVGRQLWRRGDKGVGFTLVWDDENGGMDFLDVFFGPNGEHCSVAVIPGSLQEPSEASMSCVDKQGNNTVDDALTDSIYEPIPIPPRADHVVADTGLDSLIVAGPAGPLASIEVPGLLRSGFLAMGKRLFALSSGNQIDLFAVPSGLPVGIPIRLPNDSPAHVVAFGEGLLILQDNGRSFRWHPNQQAADVGSTPARALGKTPDWYKSGRVGAGTPVTETEYGSGSWTVASPVSGTITISHPLPKELTDYESEMGDYAWLAHTSASISTDSRTLVTGAADDGLAVWNASTGQQIGKLPSFGQRLWVRDIHVGHNGRRAFVTLLSYSDLDMNCFGTGRLRYALVGIDQTGLTTQGVVQLPAGRVPLAVNSEVTIALVAHRSDLWLLNIDTGEWTLLPPRMSQAPIRAAFDQDGERVAVATRDGQLKVWNMRTLVLLVDQSEFDDKADSHNGMPCDDDYAMQVGPLQFSPDGDWVGIRLWRENTFDDSPNANASDDLFSLTRVGFRLSSTQVRHLAGLSERIAGFHYDANGLRLLSSQPTLDELGAFTKCDPDGINSLVESLILRGQ